MTAYTVTLKFISDAERDVVEDWALTLVDEAPEGAHVEVRREPLTLNGEDLTEAHVGYTVRFDVGFRRVEGKLGAVYKTVNAVPTLVVNDVVWPLPFGVVQVLDW